MLGWLLLGALFAAVVISIVVPYLDKKVAKRELRDRNIRKAVVRSFVHDKSIVHIKMDAITDDGEDVEVDVETDDYDSYEVRIGTEIYT